MQIRGILEQACRGSDYLIRWGGEEFLVIARFSERSKAPEFAERLRQAIESHIFDIGDGKVLKKSCSMVLQVIPFYHKPLKHSPALK